MTASMRPGERYALMNIVARNGLVIALLALTGCTSMSSTSMHSQADDEKGIAEFNRQYLAAINGGDAAALGRLTTEDHMMISSGGAPMVGRAAMVEAMTRGFQTTSIEEHWMPQETVISGDLAYQRGTYTVAATPKAGGATRKTSGNFLRIYRRLPDGSWNMVRDVFNSSTPSASPAPAN